MPNDTGKAGGSAPTPHASTMPPYEVGMFESQGVRLYYEIHGHGPRVLVFMHGILMDANMNRRLANDLAARGNRVILLDLPGHGLSEKPKRASFHRMDTYAEHVVALLDHLGVDRAVIGGVSLGGNVSLLVAALAPERVQGLVIEMPVLEWALPAAAITFIPMLLAVHFARPVVRRAAALFRRLPRTGIGPARQHDEHAVQRPGRDRPPSSTGSWPDPSPRPSTSVPPWTSPAWSSATGSTGSTRSTMPSSWPARLPQGRLVEANSLLELRMRPERLTDQIAEFLDGVWLAARPDRPRSRLSRTRLRSSSGPGGGTACAPRGAASPPAGARSLAARVGSDVGASRPGAPPPSGRRTVP